MVSKQKVQPGEPSLRPKPPDPWLQELKQRYPDTNPEASLPVLGLLNLGRDMEEKFASHLQRLGLTMTRFSLVMMIYRMEWESGGAVPSRLAAESHIGRAAITQLLDGLDSTGWIERRPDDEDRRRTIVRLTRKGRRKLESFLPEHYRRLEAVLGDLSQQDRKDLGQLIDVLRQSLRTVT